MWFWAWASVSSGTLERCRVKSPPAGRCLWNTCINVCIKVSPHFFFSASCWLASSVWSTFYLLRLPSGNILGTYWKQQWYRLLERRGRVLAVFLPSKSLLSFYWGKIESVCFFLLWFYQGRVGKVFLSLSQEEWYKSVAHIALINGLGGQLGIPVPSCILLVSPWDLGCSNQSQIIPSWGLDDKILFVERRRKKVCIGFLFFF